MGVDIQIEGVSYLGPRGYTVPLDSVEVDQDIALQSTQAKFDVRITGTWNGTSWSWPIARPKAGQEVVFLNAAGTREFGGILVNAEEEEVAQNVMVYHCMCGDYTKWFDRHLVNANYQQGITVQQLISDVVSGYVNTPGNSRTFTTNNVQQFPSIPLPIQQFVYIPPSQVLGQLQQMLEWGFYIDFYRDVNFFSTENFISPLPNNTLDTDDVFLNPQNTSNLPNWVDLKIKEDTSQLKNRVYITGIYIAQQASFSETKVGDGQTTVFSLGYQPPNDVSKITVEVGGSYYQIANDIIDGTPGGPTEPSTAYVNFSSQTVRFGAAPASGTLIVITYYPMTQQAVMVEDPNSQRYMASIDGTDGVYEFNRMDPSLSAETPSLAQNRASMTLNKYAMPHLEGSFRSFLPGWRVGQYFTLKSKRRFQGEFDGQTFFVTRVSKSIVQVVSGGDWLWQYNITISNVPFSF